ncbi:hypothetical protein GBAR_LOCUS19636 [Geodia barretti]|uniref:Uncharacterized protein n=1 Tax=Geodia barretti TaxID=519541 RepID=A0AA35STB4_GEOBA|nr:hypothetical protein GBAR_LOCUS19636 [Geodia barretti]
MTIVETTVTKRDVVCLNTILCIYYSAYSVNGVALPVSTCMWISIVCMYPHVIMTCVVFIAVFHPLLGWRSKGGKPCIIQV